ncbi:hypothetical protein Nepgr_018015 [Nepenthes gracilis]|uniref:Uncharacterized protein n=1 Tax=Nepenthes gracilis TaxID=150966 RepID=A0AAD3SST0_NEPGR|nr:hypothetical protein Nepgr_018015 [Nepenthes gracilis]
MLAAHPGLQVRGRAKGNCKLSLGQQQLTTAAVIHCNGRGSFSVRFGSMERNSRGYISRSALPCRFYIQTNRMEMEQQTAKFYSPSEGVLVARLHSTANFRSCCSSAKFSSKNLQHTTLHQQFRIHTPTAIKATSAHLQSSKKRHLLEPNKQRIETNHKVSNQYHLSKDIKPTIAVRL